MILKKRKGYVLLNAVIASILLVLISKGLAIHSGSHFATLSASRVGMYTQALAISKGKEIELTSYANAASVAEHRALISGSTEYEREVLVGDEVNLGGSNKKRDITINIYKNGETVPRETNIVTLTLQGSSSVPSGTICIWHGSVATIPYGWALCDGNKGTPDLRSRFVYGAGGDVNTKASYGVGWNNVNGHWPVGNTGGEELHVLTISEMPAHNHGGTVYSSQPILQGVLGGHVIWGTNRSNPSEVDYPLMYSNNLSVSLMAQGGDVPHNIMPRFMTLAYIMKL